VSDTIDILSDFAPRNWCKWALLGMLNHCQIKLYSFRGQAKFSVSASQLQSGAKYVLNIGERGHRDRKGMAIPADIERDYDIKLSGWEKRDWDDEFVVHKLEWGETETPMALASGHSMWGEFDWNANTLKLEHYTPDPDSTWMFEYDDIVGDSIDPRLIHNIDIREICFDLLEVEQLAPQANFDKAATSRNDPVLVNHPRVGRPPKWDWAGSIGAVVALANTPDGIPMEKGGQAAIERTMAEWFVQETGSQPATSQIRHHAQTIAKMIGLK